MATITENQLGFVRLATFTSANTTYPVDLVTDPHIKNVAVATPSAANGIAIANGGRYANQRVAIHINCQADDPCTAAFQVYGYIRRTLTTLPSTFTELDYTASAAAEIPWSPLLSLNEGSTISVTTTQAGGQNSGATSANGWIYNEVITVGAMYERIRIQPWVLTGTNVSCTVDVGWAGGQR